MEPVDPGKNIEGTGYSKRRISSILKAPRKSLLLRDSEQQENEVETAKLAEKRNSRRVSFAPANDVLLFAKDAKNASPARNPLQELMGAATATTENRVQMVTDEDTSPQIIGIDSLLNAPLHSSQQKLMVHFDSGSGIGENTVVFSTEDADMDMTHSHTININSDADLLGDPDHQNYNLLLSGVGNVADVFTEAPPSHFVQATNQASTLLLDKKAYSSVETRTVSTAAALLDPDFKDFLSSLSKLSPSMTPLSSDDIKSSLAADVDKENQMPKSLSSSRNIGESFNGSAFRPDDDVTMDVTEAQTARILGANEDDDDDPFKFLFPTQEMYEKSERKSQASETKQQQSCESLESDDRKANKSLINLSLHTPLESHTVCSGLKNDFREKTVVFTADEFMDITQNLTGSIAGADRSLLQRKTPANDVDQENYPLSTNRSGVDPAAPVKPAGDFSMNMTEVQRSDDVFQFLIPSEEMQPKEILKLGRQNIDGPQSSDHKGLKTSSKLNMEPQRHLLLDKGAAPDDYRERTLRFSAGDDCLDQSHTVHISTNIKPNPLQNVNMAPSCDDVTMDMTQCLTTNIATDLASDKFLSLLGLPIPNNCDADSTTVAATSGPSDGFTVYLEDNMGMTEAQTGCILEAEVSEEMLHKHESLQAVLPTEVTHRQSVHGKTERNLHQQHEEGFGASNYTEASTKPSLKTIMHRNQVEFESTDDCREKTVRFDAADVCMDVTRCNTMDISSDLPLPKQVLAANGEKTVRFDANDAEMDVTKSHTVNILSGLPLQSFINVALPANGEKTVRFNANDAAMDITRSHTMDIAHHLNLPVHKEEVLLSADGERTQRFGSSDAEMDVTRCDTLNIMRDLPLQSFPNLTIPSNGEKTLRFSAKDAEMDVTKSHSVNVMRDFPNLTMPSNGEKTVRFNAKDAAMDVTKSHTVNIVHDLDLLPHQNVDALPADGQRTVRLGVNVEEMELTKSLTGKVLVNSNVLSDQIVSPPPAWLAANDVTMDITRSHTVSIVTDFDQTPSQITDSSPTDTERISNTFVDETGSDTKSISKNYKLTLRHSLKLLPKSGEKTTKFTTNNATMDMTHCLSANIVSNPLLHPVMSDQNSENMNDTLANKKTDSGNRGLDSNPPSSTQSDLFQTSCAQGEANRNTPSCPDSSYSRCKTKEPDSDSENESSSLGSDVGKPINKTNTEEICASVDQTEPLLSADDPPQGVSSKQNPDLESFKESVSDEYQPEAETQAVSQKMESSPRNADQNANALSSQMSRRKSLADLQAKVKRLSQLINAAPDPVAVETCTASLLHLYPNVEKNTNDAEAEQLSVATSSTPFSLKTKQLMSRLSVGSFKPKLPKRNTADELNKSAVKEPTKTSTVSVLNQRSQFDKITDIHDEELVDCEDFSETIDSMTPEKFSNKDNSSNQFSTFQPLEENFAYMDDLMSSSQRQKRSLPENEDETEKKKMCTEFTETAIQSDVDYESNMTAACAQTIDSSSSTISRCEIASESTFKHSLFESQIEDFGSDGQKKLEDGTITVLEFFNLFNIDFVIHNPRQSVLPGRLLDNSDATALDLLKDKHISRPKQMVYEADVKTLTEKVEGLKYRMQDLGKPFKTVNRSLWEEVSHFTEKELKSFGAKLKERNNFFRKQSKEQSHEMKEELYAKLVRVNLEEQNKLRGTISQADEMIQTLDGCISELEAELDAVVEKGSEDKPSLKSLQEEMSKVTETLADHERQTSELELEKKKKSSELTKLKDEERKLENYIDTLNMLNEWRLEEKDGVKDDCSVFTFLYKTLFLQLMYEKTSGNDADSKSERKITNISFQFKLNDEKSQCHARLVHKLVSQFIEGESDWVEKYPTSGHVPMLLHDVSLVVSRCRLVGEELRLLKMWGHVPFDILHISCSQTQIHVVFSSLKKLSKFEVVFGVRLTDQICVFHVHSFKNLIGNTTIQQIVEVVASLSPGRNLLTRIIKKLHETLLS